MKRTFKALILSVFVVLLAQPLAGLSVARANPLLVMAVALGMEAGFVESFFIADKVLAEDDHTGLKITRTALDGSSEWRYKVFDGDSKNGANLFRTENDAREFYQKRLEQKSVH